MKLPHDDSDVVGMKPASHAVQADRLPFEKIGFGCAFGTSPTNDAEEKEDNDEVHSEQGPNCTSIGLPNLVLHLVGVRHC
jgi:hypothetical protein